MKHAVFLAFTQKGKMVKVELKLLPEPVESWPANYARLPGVAVDTCGDAEKDAWAVINEVVQAINVEHVADGEDEAPREAPRKERPWNWHLNHAEANVNDLLSVLLSKDMVLSDETEEDILCGILKHIRDARTEFVAYLDAAHRGGGEGR